MNLFDTPQEHIFLAMCAAMFGNVVAAVVMTVLINGIMRTHEETYATVKTAEPDEYGRIKLALSFKTQEGKAAEAQAISAKHFAPAPGDTADIFYKPAQPESAFLKKGGKLTQLKIVRLFMLISTIVFAGILTALVAQGFAQIPS